MRGLWAALGKDLRLFRSGTGLFCLLLPGILLLAFLAGGGNLAGRVYLEPFPIALRDEDGTIMSRSLAGQMEQVELFSQVLPAEGERDEDLLAQGCAAVVTLPRDFFYTLYNMRENTVRVVLNEDMPLEASLFQSVFTSVMEIISADQAAGRAVFRFCYGELSPERQQELWNTASAQLVQDAMSRQQVFDQASQGADVQGSLERGFLACVLSVLCLFFPLAGVKTLPEELRSGILPRFLAAGGSVWALFLSKLIVSALVTIPAMALPLVLLRPERWPLVLLEGALLFFGAFGLLLFVAVWAGEAGAAQRWGNVILLLSLVLGGAVYAGELLPGWAGLLGRVTLPWYARQGLETIHAGGGAGLLLARLWPMPAMGLICGGLAALMLRRAGQSGATPAPIAMIPDGTMPAEAAPRTGLLRRLWPVTVRKLRAMSGGRTGLCCLLAVVLFCGSLAAYAMSREGPDSLTLAVSVEDPDDPWSVELLELVSAREGVTLLEADEATGRSMLGSGRIEGLLLIGAGYGSALEEGDELPLTYLSAAPAVSAQAAREIIAGQSVGQRARVRALRDAEVRLGRALDGAERSQLLEDMAREAAEAPALYEISGLSGGVGLADPFIPKPLGFAALCVMLTALTWGAWLGGEDQRRVESRMASLSGGRRLSYGSDALSLTLAGLLAGLCALLPAGLPSPWELAALAGCVWCTSALALAAARLTGLQGRVDALAPFIALITCLLGGCFGDLGQLSPGLRTISLFTPQGLALKAGTGSWWALAILVLAGAALLWLGRPPREARAG